MYTLAYANDVVLLAENENGIRLLMRKFEQYAIEKILCKHGKNEGVKI